MKHATGMIARNGPRAAATALHFPNRICVKMLPQTKLVRDTEHFTYQPEWSNRHNVGPRRRLLTPMPPHGRILKCTDRCNLQFDRLDECKFAPHNENNSTCRWPCRQSNGQSKTHAVTLARCGVAPRSAHHIISEDEAEP